jgi:hypothetical protein
MTITICPDMTPEEREDFYAAVRAAAFEAEAKAFCPMCKQPQSAPSCERREHWGV